MTLRKRIWDDRKTDDDIEMHEYVYGYHHSYQIMEDKELLRFVVRHTESIENHAYRKEKEGDLDHANRLLSNQLDKLRQMLGDVADMHGDIK